MTQDTEKLFSFDTERAALSCLIQDPLRIPEAVTAKISAAWFYEPRHEVIYDAIIECYNSNTPVETITVGEALRSSGSLEKAGGIAELSDIADCAPSAVNLPTYLKTLHDFHGKRQLEHFAQNILAEAYNGGNSQEIMDSAEAGLLAIANDLDTSGEPTIREILQEVTEDLDSAIKNQGKLNGIGTGFYDLDRFLRGMKPGQNIVLAGATSRGKTSLAMNIVEHVAVKLKIPTAVFSLEMTNKELALRLACSMSGVSMTNADSGELDDPAAASIASAMSKIGSSPLRIIDEGGLTINRFASMARRTVQRHGVKFIVLDYLQLLKGSRSENRTVEVGEISRGIKALAKNLRIPILALAQINRESERDGSRPPRLSDLRESGSIEQDADAVVFIHRPNLEDVKTGIYVAKNRNGGTGKFNLLFEPTTTRFKSMAYEAE